MFRLFIIFIVIIVLSEYYLVLPSCEYDLHVFTILEEVKGKKKKKGERKHTCRRRNAGGQRPLGAAQSSAVNIITRMKTPDLCLTSSQLQHHKPCHDIPLTCSLLEEVGPGSWFLTSAVGV